MRPCTQCGKCCIKYSDGSGLGSATELDMEVWGIFRPEVLNYLGGLADMWISPVTGNEMDRCPWLRKLPLKEKYKCRIHDVRPETCQDYPIDIEQMFEDDCEMLEAGDLDKPHSLLLVELSELRNAS